MPKKKNIYISFVKQDKIKETAHQLIEDLFDIKGALLTNESTLEDFFIETDIPGHKQMPLSKVPEKDRNQYTIPHTVVSNLDTYFVWYPPLTKEEIDILQKTERKLHIKRIEDIYGISLADFPIGEPLYVWKIAEEIAERLESERMSNKN